MLPNATDTRKRQSRSRTCRGFHTSQVTFQFIVAGSAPSRTIVASRASDRGEGVWRGRQNTGLVDRYPGCRSGIPCCDRRSSQDSRHAAPSPRQRPTAIPGFARNWPSGQGRPALQQVCRRDDTYSIPYAELSGCGSPLTPHRAAGPTWGRFLPSGRLHRCAHLHRCPTSIPTPSPAPGNRGPRCRRRPSRRLLSNPRTNRTRQSVLVRSHYQ